MKHQWTRILALVMVLCMFAGTAMADGAIQYPVEGNPTITIVRKADPDLPTVGLSSYNQSPGIKALMEQTGINIEVIEPVDNNALLVYLNSNDLPDIVIMQINGVYPGGIGKMIEDGVASDITEDLKQYAPDYWEFINSNPSYLSLAREPDGKFYCVPGTIYPGGSEYRYWIGLAARKEYLDQLGMEIPQTEDELYTYLRRCKDELGIETPFMSDGARLTNFMFNNDGCITSPSGLISTGAHVVDGVVHYGQAEPEFKGVLDFLAKLYKEGLMDTNFTVTDEATAHAAILSGKSALIYTAASRIANLMKSTDDPNFHLVGLPALHKQDGSRGDYVFASTFVEGSFTAFIPESTTGERRVNAIKLLNYMFTEAGHVLTNYGVEGSTFEYVDGVAKLTEFMTSNPDGYPLDGMLRGYAMMNWPMWYDGNLLDQRYAMPEQNQCIKAWADNNGSDYQIQNNSIKPEFSDEYARLWTDISTFIAEYRSQYIVGAKAPETFETEYLPTLESMGMGRVLEILQASYEYYNK